MNIKNDNYMCNQFIPGLLDELLAGGIRDYQHCHSGFRYYKVSDSWSLMFMMVS